MPFGSHPLRRARLRIPQVWRSFEYADTHPRVVKAVVKTLEEIYQYGGLSQGHQNSSAKKAACNLVAMAVGGGNYGVRSNPDAVRILRQAIRRRHDPEPEVRVYIGRRIAEDQCQNE